MSNAPLRLFAVAVLWIIIHGRGFAAEPVPNTPAGGATAELEVKHFGHFLQPGHPAKQVAFHDLFLAFVKAAYHITSQHSQVLRLCRYEETVADTPETLKSSRECQLSALINLGRYSEAEAMALDDGKLIPSEAESDINKKIRSWQRIALLTMNQGQLLLADKAYRKVLALSDEALSRGIPVPSNPAVDKNQYQTMNQLKLDSLFATHIWALNNLADITYSQQRFKEYETLVIDMLARIEAREQIANAWGISAIGHAMRLHHIGRRDLAKKLALLAHRGLKADAGFRDLAEPLQSYPLLSSAVATLGDERTQAAHVVSRTRLAKVYGLLGRYAEAERLLDATEELAKNYLLAPGPANPMLADVEETRADLAMLQSNFPKAVSMLRLARARAKEAALVERSLESGRRKPDLNDPLLRLDAKFLAALVGSGKHQLTDESSVREVAEILLDYSASRASVSVELASRARHAGDRETRMLLEREGRLIDALLDARGEISAQVQSKDASERKGADAVLQRMSGIYRELGFVKQQLSGRSEEDQQKDIAAQVQKFQGWLQGSRVFWQWIAHPNVNLAVRWTSTGISLAELRGSSEVIRQQVARLQAGGSLRGINEFAQLRPFPKKEAAALYEVLFGRLAQPSTGTPHWILATSALVDDIPWAALVVQSLDKSQRASWLIEQAALSVTPSWRDCLDLAMAAPAQVKRELLAVGNPLNRSAPVSLDKLSKRGVVVAAATNTASVRTVEDSAFAQELSTLSQMFPTHLVTVREGARATKAELTKLVLGDYRIIVFSTHGYLANQLAAASGPSLELTAEAGATADRFLSAAEIARFRLNADIVVLSACDTSGSDGYADSEGFSGLTSAFLFAGAHNVVATLWPVETQTTKFLTTRMLQHYINRAELGVASAMRRATLDLLSSSDGRQAHPAFWSAFVVVGQ